MTPEDEPTTTEKTTRIVRLRPKDDQSVIRFAVWLRRIRETEERLAKSDPQFLYLFRNELMEGLLSTLGRVGTAAVRYGLGRAEKDYSETRRNFEEAETKREERVRALQYHRLALEEQQARIAEIRARTIKTMAEAGIAFSVDDEGRVVFAPYIHKPEGGD
ncbi:MAG: hypothetical protein KC492_20035 [Myxococcales bacterium]|nr:hypothetical protein [Myxococcales bacterium]